MTSFFQTLLVSLAFGMTSCSIAMADNTGANGAAVSEMPQLARADYRACLKDAAGRVEQASCIKQEQAFQDEQMISAYQRLSQTMTEEQRSALDRSQEAWKAFIHADARLGVALLDPAGLDLSVADNAILLTIQRRLMLERLIALTQ